MAMRSVVSRATLGRLTISRHFSDGKGGVFSEEERAAETIYIKKMEKERLEKAKMKEEKEKAENDKASKKEEASKI